MVQEMSYQRFQKKPRLETTGKYPEGLLGQGAGTDLSEWDPYICVLFRLSADYTLLPPGSAIATLKLAIWYPQ